MKTAFPRYRTPVFITLFSNVPFDNTYKHHTLISDLFKYNNTKINTYSGSEVKERFLNRKDYTKTGYPYYYPRYDITGEYNFDYSNGLICSIVLELTPEQTNANYMRVVNHAQDLTGEIYYYFITGIQQINADTYKLSLELDVLMTYQDEFLEGMKGVPAFAVRKHSHRWTDDGLMPHCAELKTGEDAFANVKPSLITNKFNLNYLNSEMKNIKTVMWLYICIDTNGLSGQISEKVIYSCKDKNYPMVMMAIPLNVNTLTYCNTLGSYSLTYSHDKLIQAVQELIDDGSVHGARISPYPPFVPQSSYYKMSLDGSRNLTIKGSVVELQDSGGVKLYELTMGNNEFLYGDFSGMGGAKIIELLTLGCLLISTQNDTLYEYDELTPTQLGIANSDSPTPLDNRYLDPKLLFSPFRKYKISAQYCTEGSEFFPELVFSEKETAYNGHYFWFQSTASAYIGDNNIFTYISASVDTYDKYRFEKIGLASAVNYIMPCGTNALDVFNSTQAQSFYTSKVASGITSGLSIAGGIASIGVGIAGAVGSMGMSAPASAGLIAGGATAIAGGIAGIATAVASTDAKIEDLKNTPDSVNVSGSNFITDEIVAPDTYGLPYVVVYDVSSVIKENANDYFYNYGYQVSRECYFNTDLDFDNKNGAIDNNLFGRTIFNYIQLNDDITNKINYDMPLIVKQKLSKIFNDGITLWSFFGINELWASPVVPSSTYYLDRWFMKCDLDNTEYNVLINNQ